MFSFPEVAASDDRRHRTCVALRYDDVAQDGRLRIEAAQPCVGEAVWRGALAQHSLLPLLAADGIVPILRRFVVNAGDTPLSVHRPLEVDGRWALAEAEGRFVLEMQVAVHGERGHSFGHRVERAGEREPVAEIFGEHVLTRLFAPPERRRVSALPAGLTVSAARPWLRDASVLEVAGEVDEQPLERSFRFGLSHTDSNQHVNSLVYPRLFEELAVEAWQDGNLLLRALHIVWRKPCFAGEVVRLSVRRTRRGTRRGVVATVRAEGEERPRASAQLWM